MPRLWPVPAKNPGDSGGDGGVGGVGGVGGLFGVRVLGWFGVRGFSVFFRLTGTMSGWGGAAQEFCLSGVRTENFNLAA